jgi:hypothetical protein
VALPAALAVSYLEKQEATRAIERGIHHAKQWRLDHVRQIPELTACDTGDHRLAAIPLRASPKNGWRARAKYKVGGRGSYK